MPSLAQRMKSQLESQGELVVLANLENGWFAINPNTRERRLSLARSLGRTGPNLVVYRTRSGEERDHHLVPFGVISSMLTPESLKLQKNGKYRWNLTLSDDKLHVSHRKGFVLVESGLAASLLVEDEVAARDGIERERISLRTRSYAGIVEGIARESVMLSRSRSSALRREALRMSGGVCACCGIDFSLVLNGRGLRALQVHHTKQLALRETPEATLPSDLAVVCANCHSIIHSDIKVAMKVEELREAWKASRQ